MSLPQRVQDELLKIVYFVKKSDVDKVFWEPVDPVRLNLPGYHTIIQNPMDLSTVEKKLTQRVYTDIDSVVNDVTQIWKNTELFNGPNHSITKYGKDLDGEFQQKIQELKDNFERQEAAINSASRKPRNLSSPGIMLNTKEDEGDGDFNYDDTETNTIVNIPRVKAPTPIVTAIATSPTKASTEPEVSIDVKRRLCVYLNSIPAQDLPVILDILKQHQPDLASDLRTQSNAVINILELENSTLRHFEALMKSH